MPKLHPAPTSWAPQFFPGDDPSPFAMAPRDMGRVHLIVSCSKRKSRAPRPALRLRALTAADPAGRAAEWVRRLRAERSDLLPAESLYAGDHWGVVRSIAADPPGGRPVRVWVCSAGYGLITPDSLLAPYDATFGPGEPDSVARAGERPADVLPAWWAALAGWAGPPRAGCRSIAALADEFPRDFILAALSDVYLKAVRADLAAAARTLAGPERLAVLSAGTDAVPGLEAHRLPCDARLRSVAGGVLASLNVRLARRLLAEAGDAISLSRCRDVVGRWMETSPTRRAEPRAVMTDPELRAFIRSSLAEDAERRPTPMLQELRRGGRACEHRRFARLFAEVRAGLRPRPAVRATGPGR